MDTEKLTVGSDAVCRWYARSKQVLGERGVEANITRLGVAVVVSPEENLLRRRVDDEVRERVVADEPVLLLGWFLARRPGRHEGTRYGCRTDPLLVAVYLHLLQDPR